MNPLLLNRIDAALRNAQYTVESLRVLRVDFAKELPSPQPSNITIDTTPVKPEKLLESLRALQPQLERQIKETLRRMARDQLDRVIRRPKIKRKRSIRSPK